MHQKCIANIKTLCKYREKSVSDSLYVFVFQCINLQAQVRQRSSDLWIIWSIANKNESIFSSLEEVKEQRNNNGSSDSIRGSRSRWHKNVGQMSNTQTNSTAEVKKHELSSYQSVFWKGSMGQPPPPQEVVLLEEKNYSRK